MVRLLMGYGSTKVCRCLEVRCLVSGVSLVFRWLVSGGVS
jgi:hypothetical protein